MAQLASEVRELLLARASSQPASSKASFSLVPDSREAAPPASLSRRRFSPLARVGPSTPARSSGNASPSAGPGSHSTPLQPPRAEIGLFLRKCLSNEASGRDWLGTASRYWLVLRDFEGRDLSPPFVCNRFSGCAELCKRGSDLGDSVCIGLPVRQDVIAVAAAAGVDLPRRW